MQYISLLILSITAVTFVIMCLISYKRITDLMDENEYLKSKLKLMESKQYGSGYKK